MAKKKHAKKPDARTRKPIPQQVIEASADRRIRGTLVCDQDSPGIRAMAEVMDCDVRIEPGAPSPPTTARSKFWRQYQDTTTGGFIGWARARMLSAGQVISRLRLRKAKQ